MTITSSAHTPASGTAVLRLSAPDRAGLIAALDSGKPTFYTGSGPRLAMIDPTPERRATARRLVARGRPVRRRGDLWFSPQPLLNTSGGIAFVFPGLEGDFAPQVGDIADRMGVPAPEVSTGSLGRHGAAVLAVGRLLDLALRRMNIRPDAVAGHSVGEWAAMLSGGIVSATEFDLMMTGADLDALRVPGVEFMVLGCAADSVRAELRAHPDLVVSHENSANQTVVCGPGASLAELTGPLRRRGIICRPLPFQSGFHTPMLEPYLGPFRAGVPALRMRPAEIPVWSATTAAPFPDAPDAARELCVRHLLEPVRFRALVRELYRAGIRVFLQLGPGQLSSLVEDTLRHDLPDADFLAIPANSHQRTGLDQLLRCALALWTEGADPDFAVLHAPPLDPPRPEHAPTAPGWPGLTRLAALSTGTHLAADLALFLDDTAAAVAAVLQAAEATEQVLEVSLSAMPYLRDHCLMRQRPGWPYPEDLHAVVPATTMVTHMVRAVERACPGRTPVAAEDVRFRRWLSASPPQTISVTVRPESATRFHVRLGDCAEGTVVLGAEYPAAPPRWPHDANERVPALTAADIYRQHWLFHGPEFQGMTRSVGVSRAGIRGEITVPAAPGALLDNLGQFLGQWLVEHERDRWLALPARIDRITWHAPEPGPGSTVDCAARIIGLDADTVTMDGQLSRDGVPVVSVRGWSDRRFDGGDVFRAPETATAAEPLPGGTWRLAEPWQTLASRELHLHRYANKHERAEYERLPPAQRRAWLLRLIVVKDAARGWFWDHGTGPLYPAELRVHQELGDQCRVHCEHGLELPELRVTVSHQDHVAEAYVSGTPSD